MTRRRAGMLFTSVALVILIFVIPSLPVDRPISYAAHLLMGLLLGLGIVLNLNALASRRAGTRCDRS